MSTRRTVGRGSEGLPAHLFPSLRHDRPLAVPLGTSVAYALTAWIGATSVVSFLVMAWDKRRARRAGRRVRERTLLFHAVLGGGPGSWLAMRFVRHKTRHPRFRILVPLAALAWIFLLAFVWLG